MNRHLSVFLPYDRPPQHEDQLTRAAMIVMRAVPLARDALLARIGAPTSARLPEVELDMQTPHVVVPPPRGADAEPFVLQELVSVFLSPDVGLALSSDKIQERDGEQRLDGVLRFGSDLAVAIESKIVGLASTQQAEQLRTRGVEVKRSRIVSLGSYSALAHAVEDEATSLQQGRPIRHGFTASLISGINGEESEVLSIIAGISAACIEWDVDPENAWNHFAHGLATLT